MASCPCFDWDRVIFRKRPGGGGGGWTHTARTADPKEPKGMFDTI